MQALLAAKFLAMVIMTVNRVRARDGRLIGGSESNFGEFPWIVSLQRTREREDGNFKHFCGSGAILDSTTVVTAAHCVWDKAPREVAVLAGSLRITTQDATDSHQQFRKVQSVLVNPNYTTRNKPGRGDLAVLKLGIPLTFNDYVKSIAILSSEESMDSLRCCVTMGWGNTFPMPRFYFSRGAKLEMLKAKVIPDLFCQLAYPFLRGQLRNTLCVTSGIFKGACSGDSGNPLVCYNKDRVPYLVGLGSWGWAICGDGVHPDVYTDIRGIHSFLKGNSPN